MPGQPINSDPPPPPGVGGFVHSLANPRVSWAMGEALRVLVAIGMEDVDARAEIFGAVLRQTETNGFQIRKLTEHILLDLLFNGHYERGCRVASDPELTPSDRAALLLREMRNLRFARLNDQETPL